MTRLKNIFVLGFLTVAVALLLSSSCDNVTAENLSAPESRQKVIRSVDVGGEQYLLLPDIAEFYAMTYHVDGNNFNLTSVPRNLSLSRNSTVANVNDTRVFLGLPVVLWEGTAVLSQRDFNNVLQPILNRRSLPRQQVRRVVIDPGHGGRDPGAVGQNRRVAEKDVTLAISLRLRTFLQEHGIEVVMTRANDRALTLAERIRIANEANADLFVSIHANSSSSTSARGIETFVHTPFGTISTNSRKMNNNRAANDDFVSQNFLIGYCVQREMIKNIGWADRGLKRENFYVLRNAPCPAILVEVGFLSNPEEERLLADPVYQHNIAASIAMGIFRYRKDVE